MGETGNEGPQRGTERDPLVRFLFGCLAVVAVIVAILVIGFVFVGWRLTRDETPGRAAESFLVGDETQYWCLELRPDDRGLQSLFQRFDDINESTRRELVHGTFLEALPLPHRRARLDDLAPLTAEVGLVMSEPAGGPQRVVSWDGRASLSHGMFKLRAGIKLMRFFLSRHDGTTAAVDIGGVTVTETHDANAQFAVANIGNRVIVTNNAQRMRAILEPASGSTGSIRQDVAALHEAVKLDGEDAWAFVSGMTIGGGPAPLSILGAAGSFDVNALDELAFQIAVEPRAAAPEQRSFAGTGEDCRAVVSTFLPGVSADAIELDAAGAHRLPSGAFAFTGKVSGLSKRFAAALGQIKAGRLRERMLQRAGPETPSATPTPPSPQPR